MVKSKPWNWQIGANPYWEESSSEVYPLINRWRTKKLIKLLDLGCGIGRHSLLFARNDFEVTAFDLSKEGVEKIKQTAKIEGLVIKTRVGDMLNLPFDDNLFDCLIAYNVIYHTDEVGIQKSIDEIHRVLKNGGEALITFNSQSNSAFTDPQNQHISEHVLYKTNRAQELGIPHYYAQKKDIPELLKDFKIIQFGHREEYWDNDYNNCHYYVLVSNIKH